MSNIKKYTIDYDWKAELTVEIDHDIVTEQALTEINEFWSGHEYRVMKHGSVLNAVLVMLAQHAIPLVYEHSYNTYGAVSLFDWDEGNGQEGWPPMDGTNGFKIVGVETDGLFDSDDMTIKVIN